MAHSSKTKGIDYSKWDKMDFSDDDDDDDDNSECEKESSTPRVTSLDTPSRVQWNKDGKVEIVPQPQAHERSDEAKSGGFKSASSSVITTTAITTSTTREWTFNGGEFVIDNNKMDSDEKNSNDNSNENVPLTVYWSQDRYNVEMRIEIPPGSKGKDLSVSLKGALPYSQRASAAGSSTGASLTIYLRGSILLQGELPHWVHLPQPHDSEDSDNNDNDLVDWEIVEGPSRRRFVHLTVHKAVPMAGMALSWRRPFTHVAERKQQQSQPETQSSTNASFQKAWEEAHRQFRENVKNKKQTQTVI